MESETQSEVIEQTVLAILKYADLEEATEFMVRTMAAERLGTDLSGQYHKRLVRRVVESYLLSLGEDKEVEEQTKVVLQKQGVTEHDTDAKKASYVERQVICKLSEKRGVAVHEFRGKTLVSLREYFRKNGKLLPSPRGISLSMAEWSAFRKCVPDIEAAVTKMGSLIKSEDAGKQVEGDLSNSVTAFAEARETKQTEADITNSGTDFAPQGLDPMATKQAVKSSSATPQGLHPMETKQTEANISCSVTAFEPQGFTRIETEQSEVDKSKSETALAPEGPQGLIPPETIPTYADFSSFVTAFGPTKQTGADKSSFGNAYAPQGLTHMEMKQTKEDESNSLTARGPQGFISSGLSRERQGDGLFTFGWGRSTSSLETKQIGEDKSSSAVTFGPQGLISLETKQIGEVKSSSAITFGPQGLIPSDTKQIGEDKSSSVITSAPQGLVPLDAKQIEADKSNSVTGFGPQGLVPLHITRLDGKNYHYWVHQMELFLKQLKVVYVLIEPCPSSFLGLEASFGDMTRARAAVQKWVDDDYICRHSILNSLSDNLFDLYSKKTRTAKELWEELKLAYDEDFGTKRSQVNKYIQFQMVDGISILEQVRKLHEIADSIIASGTWIDENFHVSAIISKLPPSWKEYRTKLMHEEFLPLNALMNRLRVEEESCNRFEIPDTSMKAGVEESRAGNKLGPKKKDLKRPGMNYYRKLEKDTITCFKCGKEGHTARHCQRGRVYIREPSREKGSEENIIPVIAEANIVEGSVE